MATGSQKRSLNNAAGGRDLQRPAHDATLFGVPVGQLGWFASLLMGLATGFAAFFLATFLAIVSLLVINTAGHPMDYALSYRRVGVPVGVVVGVLALCFFAFNWIRRKLAHE